jgi:hypothetical protein
VDSVDKSRMSLVYAKKTPLRLWTNLWINGVLLWKNCG